MRKPVLLRGLTILLAGALAMPSCIKVGGKPLNEGNAEKRDISSPGSPPSIGALHLSSNVLTIIGDNLQEVSRVRLEGAASRELQVISATPNSLLVAASSPLALALGAAYQLVISNAHGDDTVPFSFNIASGNLTESGSSVLTITGGAGAVLGSGTTIQVKQANASQAGFLSAADWSAFNGKEPAITAGTSAQYLKGDKTLGTFGTDVLSAISGNVTETALSFSDIATGNASTSKHGLLPKLPGGTTNFLREDGTWAAPPASANLTTATGFGTAAAGAVTLGTNGQHTVLNGNVGIGTTSPSFKLEITGSSSAERTLGIDSLPVLYLPKQGNGVGQLGGSIAVGNGLRSLANTSGNEGRSNTAIGIDALLNNSTGHSNLAVGFKTLESNTTGDGNNGIGHWALNFNTTGMSNAAFGNNTLLSNTTGYYNTAVGTSALYANSTGYENAALGTFALQTNFTGYSNSAIGMAAGAFTPAYGSNEASNTSVYLGAETKASANGNSNEIVIGYSATGNGSNTVTLGNDAITKTVLKGDVGIGAAAPKATLDVDGYARLKSHSSAPVACDPAHGGSIALTSTYGMCVCNGADWVLVNTATLCTW